MTTKASTNEIRSSGRLEEAKNVAIEYESVLDAKDREVIEAKITQ
jgi:hypothetical protein